MKLIPGMGGPGFTLTGQWSPAQSCADAGAPEEG